MEFTLSGNALKTLARSITCHPSFSFAGDSIDFFPAFLLLLLLLRRLSCPQLRRISFHALNSSRSAYQLITFKPDLFDAFTVSGAQVQCSVLPKAVCSVLKMPISNIDYLSVQLPDINASKVQWALQCFNGKDLSIPRQFCMRPRDLNRLLANFLSSLWEITIIAMECNSNPSDAASEFGGTAVEFRSYVDPTKENDSLLHTQLWIDPVEEFVQYAHNGNPVDVTFAVKELKAFLAFCEGCEMDIHLYFEKAGEPILMAPKFGIDEGTSSNFDATLVLTTMLPSQLHEGNIGPSANGMPGQADTREASGEHLERNRTSASEIPSNHTRIWFDSHVMAVVLMEVPEERILKAGDQLGIERISTLQISKTASAEGNIQTVIGLMLMRDDDNKDELCVQSTLLYYEDQ
ncbi:hypothetical protein ACJRO7_032988 [Eucalyptus globulus]|uniref:Uncharacterized protein n=1 Tax=Eucalyptus globulus TaxID=34317 RepID=A0ABD3JNX5_EUCGL